MVAGMAAFLVFRELPGVTRDQYSAAQRAVADAIGQAAVSRQVRYRGGFFLPAQARAICVFDAGSAADVAAVNQQAGVPFTEVVEAVDLRLAGPLSGGRAS
jgi:Protein of unknown function (DUF4242)